MTTFFKCSSCKHIYSKLIDGWKVCCEAFPNGIPQKISFETDVENLTECNNGIKYEPVDKAPD